MLVFVSDTTRSAPNIRSISPDGSAPSASAITVTTSAPATSAPAPTAMNVALHTPGPISAGAGITACRTATLSVAVSANCATLKAILTGAVPRVNSRTTSGPRICASTRSCGVASSSPMTSGISESDSVCALPRMCAWMTKTSVAANASASPHHGICHPPVYAGRSRTTPT